MPHQITVLRLKATPPPDRRWILDTSCRAAWARRSSASAKDALSVPTRTRPASEWEPSA